MTANHVPVRPEIFQTERGGRLLRYISFIFPYLLLLPTPSYNVRLTSQVGGKWEWLSSLWFYFLKVVGAGGHWNPRADFWVVLRSMPWPARMHPWCPSGRAEYPSLQLRAAVITRWCIFLNERTPVLESCHPSCAVNICAVSHVGSYCAFSVVTRVLVLYPSNVHWNTLNVWLKWFF